MDDLFAPFDESRALKPGPRWRNVNGRRLPGPGFRPERISVEGVWTGPFVQVEPKKEKKKKRDIDRLMRKAAFLILMRCLALNIIDESQAISLARGYLAPMA